MRGERNRFGGLFEVGQVEDDYSVGAHTRLKPRRAKSLFTIFSVEAPKMWLWTNCKLELSFLSQFFHHRRHFSSYPKDLSTTHRLGKMTNACSS